MACVTFQASVAESPLVIAVGVALKLVMVGGSVTAPVEPLLDPEPLPLEDVPLLEVLEPLLPVEPVEPVDEEDPELARWKHAPPCTEVLQ